MNSRLLSLVSLLRTAPGLLLLLAAGCTNPGAVSPPTTATPPAAVTEGAFDDDAHQPTTIELAVIAAGKDPVKLAALERDLLAKMQDPASPPALVQEAAQHLGRVMQVGDSGPAATTLAVLAPMLSDPAKLDYARLALDRVPGESVDALYLAALPGSTGRVRLGLVQSAAARGLTTAIPLLAPWLNDTDPALATATAQALGRIGGPDALAALASARQPLAPAVLNARLAAAAKIDATKFSFSTLVGGRPLFHPASEIYRNTAAPLPQRSAALRQLIDADPARAAEEIYAALSSGEPAFQNVAIAAISVPEVPVPSAELADRLGSYPPNLQVALIAALGTRGHAGAIPGLLKALDAPDAEVRIAAIEVLGRLPGTMVVAKRLATAAAGKGDEAKAAAASLARLNGPRVDSSIRLGAETASPLQIVFVQQLAARNETEAIPFLLDLRYARSEPLRLEALDALRAIAASTDEPAIIAWTLGTTSQVEQTRAVRALITIILRDGNVATRAEALIAAIKAGAAPARLVLLPALSRVAGAPALAAAGTLVRDLDETVAKAATAELARWPDATVLPTLVELTASTPNAAIRVAAAQGSARFLAGRSNATAAQRSQYTRQLLALPLDPAAQIDLLNVLSLGADQESLATARRLLVNPATAAAAQDAIDAITSNLAGPPAFTASEAGDKTAFLTDGRRNTYWSVPNTPGGWLRADLRHSRPLRKITLDQGQREWDWPDKLEVCVSDDPAQPGEPRAQVEGTREQTVVTLPAGTRGRYVWLRQQGTRPSNAWAVAEFILE